VFWTLPTAFLSGASAAGGIALINSLGNFGGYAGPQLLGFVKDQTQSFAVALLTLAALMAFAGIVALSLGHNARRMPQEAGADLDGRCIRARLPVGVQPRDSRQR
jgi:ACS family tartrate transporter-like MFS transporter